MREDDIDARLDALRGTRRYVTLARAQAPALGGVIEDLGDSLILVQELRDFHRRGFVVLRRDEVTALHADEVERHFGAMIESEGVLSELREAPALDLDHWSDCLRALRRRYGALSLERSCSDGFQFYLGRITGVSREALSLRCITVEGAIERTPIDIALDEISLVTFDDRYSAFFDRHALDEDRH